MPLLRLFLLLVVVALPSVAFSNITEGKKSITLKTNAGDTVTIGSVTFSKKGDEFTYELVMDDSPFSNHFLSMRPFKCLKGPNHMLCHLVYPYEKEPIISKDLLTSLEYDLLFIHRQSSDYGIDPWNGIYYRLKINEDGSLSGTLTEVDLNILAAPPDEGVKWPIGKADLNETEASSHSYPVVTIE